MSNFSTIYNRRNTFSVKWDMLDQIYSLEDTSDVLSMWIADMDFAIAPVIRDAIHKRMEHPIFGYAITPEEAKTALSNWVLNKHQLTIENEWILFRQGVIPAMAEAVEVFTEPGDKVLIHTPVYPPFTSIPQNLGREVITCRLTEKDNGYEMDFGLFEKCLQKGIKVFILCNPHNPGGKVWNKEDLRQMAALCKQYNVLILSDEIHADLTYKPFQHTPLFNAAEDISNIITFFAPTKTFNIAGIQAAATIVPDEEKRKTLEHFAMTRGVMGLNIFALTALQTAYEEGGPWLEELMEVLSSNMDYAVEHLSKIDGITVVKPEGTYLLWINYRGTGLSEQDIMARLLTKGRLALEPGTKYGDAGDGFLRMNCACPFETIQDGVSRFTRALE
ncbi:MalY/PatB family protein [Psychrobacillus lasiicapitis]|uniref:cysteine-S-conjugate beta-lyase n=1 Tax=Psychrobacillus lasiicapitis TaxID=1636719 RepID=A0A544T0B5_9BACI|nr:MalY/PatB family protein [Psychrobacillus lasiicapitis]TQR10830.1 pyridoxal phosphate-dependent aminotransferase [Psychrobacillus lasiicapitis]GGA42138.1 cystathionine beta-lyase PatB [Psychrobacillus lasiicapitis]